MYPAHLSSNRPCHFSLLGYKNTIFAPFPHRIFNNFEDFFTNPKYPKSDLLPTLLHPSTPFLCNNSFYEHTIYNIEVDLLLLMMQQGLALELWQVYECVTYLLVLNKLPKFGKNHPNTAFLEWRRVKLYKIRG